MQFRSEPGEEVSVAGGIGQYAGGFGDVAVKDEGVS
jgi:hypothetical protein